MTMHSVELSGGKIAYRKAGNGPPMLLLHGWGSSSRYWQGTLAALGATRTLYAPDLPGYGESPPQHATVCPESMAQLVIDFAEAVGLEYPFDLNGHSFSAAVSAHIAVGWRERVRYLVLTCPCTYHNDPGASAGTRHPPSYCPLDGNAPFLDGGKNTALSVCCPLLFLPGAKRC